MGTTTSHESNTNTMASADEKCTPPSVMDFPDDGAKQHVLKGNTQRNGPVGLSAAPQRDTTRSLSACPPHPLVQSHPHATPLPSGERAEDSAMDEVAAEAEAKADETTTMPAEPTLSSADAAAKERVYSETMEKETAWWRNWWRARPAEPTTSSADAAAKAEVYSEALRKQAWRQNRRRAWAELKQKGAAYFEVSTGLDATMAGGAERHPIPLVPALRYPYGEYFKEDTGLAATMAGGAERSAAEATFTMGETVLWWDTGGSAHCHYGIADTWATWCSGCGEVKNCYDHVQWRDAKIIGPSHNPFRGTTGFFEGQTAGVDGTYGQYEYDILVPSLGPYAFGVMTSSLRKSDAATVAARRTPPDARVVDWDCTPPNLDTGKGLGENATSDASQVPTGELGTCNTLPALLMERSLPTPHCPWSRPRCPQPPTCTAQQRTPANSHSHHRSSSCP